MLNTQYRLSDAQSATNERFLINHIALAIGFIFLFLISEKPTILHRLSGIQASNISFFAKLFIYFSVTGIWVVALGAVYFLTRSRPVFKWTGFVLIIIPTFVFDVFYGASTEPLLYEDYIGLRLAVANTQDALREYLPHFFYPFIRSSLLWCAFLVTPEPVKGSELKASVLMLCCLAIFVGVCIGKKGTATDKIPGFFSLYGFEIAMQFDGAKYHYNYSNVPFEPKTKPKRDNIVLIIDESVRYDFINGIETLSDGRLAIKSTAHWNVYDFGDATSGSNCSAFSNLILRKGPKPDRIDRALYENPLIWAYAKKAGYRTTLIDNQGGGRWHDYFDSEELKLIDNNVATSNYRWDRDIIDGLKGLLKEKGNFIIIIKKGAHFPYSMGFPPNYAPSFQWQYINEQQNRVDYARAISFQTTEFFEELLKEAVQPSTLMIYTSDHGQNLNDTRGLTHCTATGKPFQGEGMVPMLIVDNTVNEEALSYSQKNHNKTSHYNIMATLLHYFGYDKGDYLSHYEPPLTEPLERLGYFGYGSPFGFFGAKPTVKQADEVFDYARMAD